MQSVDIQRKLCTELFSNVFYQFEWEKSESMCASQSTNALRKRKPIRRFMAHKSATDFLIQWTSIFPLNRTDNFYVLSGTLFSTLCIFAVVYGAYMGLTEHRYVSLYSFSSANLVRIGIRSLYEYHLSTRKVSRTHITNGPAFNKEVLLSKAVEKKCL